MEKTTPALKMRTAPSREVFKNPFSSRYWQLALKEFASVRTLVLAAIIIAIRVAIKELRIPIVPPSVYLGFDFLINSAGSMIYGPIVALLVGAVSDTLGAVLFPIGTYFFPFIVVEMLSGFIFALFFYRQQLSTRRIILARAAVVIICNFIVNPLIMTWSNYVFLKAPYEFITIARVLKNAAMFPLECLILVFWLGALSAATYKLGYTYCKPKKLEINFIHILSLVLALIISVGAIVGYSFYKYKTDSEKAIMKAFGGKEKVELVVERKKTDDGTFYVGTLTGADGRSFTLSYDPVSKFMPERSNEILNKVAEAVSVEAKELNYSNITFVFPTADVYGFGWCYTFTDEEREKLNIEYDTVTFDGAELQLVPYNAQ